jgi:hypothetical protein
MLYQGIDIESESSSIDMSFPVLIVALLAMMPFGVDVLGTLSEKLKHERN